MHWYAWGRPSIAFYSAGEPLRRSQKLIQKHWKDSLSQADLLHPLQRTAGCDSPEWGVHHGECVGGIVGTAPGWPPCCRHGETGKRGICAVPRHWHDAISSLWGVYEYRGHPGSDIQRRCVPDQWCLQDFLPIFSLSSKLLCQNLCWLPPASVWGCRSKARVASQIPSNLKWLGWTRPHLPLAYGAVGHLCVWTTASWCILQERKDELKTSKGEIHSTDEVGHLTQAGWMCGKLLQKLTDLNCKTRQGVHFIEASRPVSDKSPDNSAAISQVEQHSWFILPSSRWVLTLARVEIEDSRKIVEKSQETDAKMRWSPKIVSGLDTDTVKTIQ